LSYFVLASSSRESFGLDKAKKKNLSPEDRLKMAEVNPSGNEN
jgi:hypothetical protein